MLDIHYSACLSVDIKSGDIIVQPTKIQSHLLIPEGVYHANEWCSYVEVINFADFQQKIVIEQPINGFPVDQNQYFAVHNYSIEHLSKQPDIDISELLRTDHFKFGRKQRN